MRSEKGFVLDVSEQAAAFEGGVHGAFDDDGGEGFGGGVEGGVGGFEGCEVGGGAGGADVGGGGVDGGEV